MTPHNWDVTSICIQGQIIPDVISSEEEIKEHHSENEAHRERDQPQDERKVFRASCFRVVWIARVEMAEPQLPADDEDDDDDEGDNEPVFNQGRERDEA